ncbi:PEP-CTERM sorting domain-containing protein [Sphingobium sp. H33]|uniref:PEP-CTERM sorting domain-containing protein n=1 Tax=Sphingobium nicotianae TaxID=2782607 RepID=A0A9X1DB90_9SPHN|nr:PEP-CTERM sorting domain-containing protein [Sphingobium nicotianae]
MDPTAGLGEFLSITGNDKLALDVVGWDLKQASPPTPGVPEPATWAMMIGGFALAGVAMRRRKVAVSFV